MTLRVTLRVTLREADDTGDDVLADVTDDVLDALEHAVATRADELEALPPRGRRARRTQHDAVQLLPLPCGPCWRSRRPSWHHGARAARGVESLPQRLRRARERRR